MTIWQAVSVLWYIHRISCKHLVSLKNKFFLLSLFLYFFLGLKTKGWKKIRKYKCRKKMLKWGRSKNEKHVLPVKPNLWLSLPVLVNLSTIVWKMWIKKVFIHSQCTTTLMHLSYVIMFFWSLGLLWVKGSVYLGWVVFPFLDILVFIWFGLVWFGLVCFGLVWFITI